MKRYINLGIRSEVLLTFVLLFFSLVGYVPNWPYMLSNLVLLLLPAFVLLNIRRIRLSNNSIAFIACWLLISIIPYLVNSSEMFAENTTRKIFVNSLKIFGVLCAVFLGYTNTLKYNDLCKVLFAILIVNFTLMTIQFFIMKPMDLVGEGLVARWVYKVNTQAFWKLKVVGICGNANTVGSFVLFVTVFLFYWLKQKGKLLWITILLSAIAIGFYAKSRNNILVGLLFIGFYLFFVKKKLFPVLNYSLFALFFLVVVFFSASSEVTDTIFKFSSFKDKVNSLSIRLVVNKEAFNIWWYHLFWFGGGMGSETYFMGKLHATRLWTEMLYTKYLLEMGFVGCCSSAFFLYFLYRNKLKDFFQRRLFKNLLFIVFFVSFFETVFYTQQLFYFIIFLLAWLSSHKIDDWSIPVQSHKINYI